MNCPVCAQVSLLMTERSGIEIDYCPKCRGGWLDRGELDKLIERAAVAPARPAPASTFAAEAGPYAHEPVRGRDGHRPGTYQHDAYHHGAYHHKKKRDSFLGELFDFD